MDTEENTTNTTHLAQLLIDLMVHGLGEIG